MQRSLAFILGLLDWHSPAFVAQEDFDGVHGRLLRLWQRRGFLSTKPERNPVPSCPYCREGAPYLLGGRYLLLGVCQSTVDPRHLLLWRFDLEAFLSWLARALELSGGVQQVEESLWQLGSVSLGGLPHECFFRRGGTFSQQGETRLLAFRSAILLSALPHTERVSGFRGPCLTLVELLCLDRRSLKVTNLALLLQGSGAVRFEEESGALFAGDSFLGEVPLGTKEYFLLAYLAQPQNRDRYVPYGDLKHEVLQKSGSTDTTDEATFCHKLKGRIKERGLVPKIDRLIATTNKGNGYRLRGYLGDAWEE